LKETDPLGAFLFFQFDAVAFPDRFESGFTGAWSSTSP
jgi:hypothetical protein